MSDDILYIGIMGAAGSGKDTVANYICSYVGSHIIAHRIAMADPLKRSASELYGVPLERFYEREGKEEIIEGLGVSPRWIAQNYGTEVVRDMDPDHWVKRFDREVEDVLEKFNQDYNNNTPEYFLNRINYPTGIPEVDLHSATNLIVIPDVRFPNEQQMIIDKGGWLLYVDRTELDTGEDMDYNHSSETSIDVDNHDYILINNHHSVKRLRVEVIATLNYLGLR